MITQIDHKFLRLIYSVRIDMHFTTNFCIKRSRTILSRTWAILLFKSEFWICETKASYSKSKISEFSTRFSLSSPSFKIYLTNTGYKSISGRPYFLKRRILWPTSFQEQIATNKRTYHLIHICIRIIRTFFVKMRIRIASQDSTLAEVKKNIRATQDLLKIGI